MRARIAAAIFGITVLASGRATAEDPGKARCADAYESTQKLERAGKLTEALAEVAICAHPACPELLRADCMQWLSPLRARQSSVVVEAHDASGAEVFLVKVFVDGVAVQAQLDGRAFFVNPGHHTLRFEGQGGEREEREVVVREGEQGRRIVVTLTPPRGAGPLPAPLAPAERSASSSPGIPTLSYVLGGVGLAALGSFTYFGLSGSSLEATLDRECSPRCASARVDAVQTQYIVADVSLGVGIISLGVAAWLALTNRSQP